MGVRYVELDNPLNADSAALVMPSPRPPETTVGAKLSDASTALFSGDVYSREPINSSISLGAFSASNFLMNAVVEEFMNRYGWQDMSCLQGGIEEGWCQRTEI